MNGGQLLIGVHEMKGTSLAQIILIPCSGIRKNG